jgi:predicted nucleotidyltransferase
MDAEVERYLSRLVATAREVLGEDLVGAYAAGSVALHDYSPERSDIDIALVCEGTVPRIVKDALVAQLRHEALPCPARGLELVLYRRAAARSGTREPDFELELNSGARMAFRATFSPGDRPASDGRFWYALDRSIVKQSGRALMGPPAGEMFADLTAAELIVALVEALEWWLANASASPDDAVLGACRALVKVRDGVWLSKVAAGRRLLGCGLDDVLIQQAIDARGGGILPSADRAGAFQKRVRDELASRQ